MIWQGKTGGSRALAAPTACALLLACLAGGLLGALPAGSYAASSTRAERQREKQAAEQERAALRERLSSLRRQIEKTESARSHAADALASSERAISEANRALADLADEQQDAASRLARLQEQKQALERDVTKRREQLARLARDQYLAGNDERTRLLLSGDNPHRINRDLQYLDYLNRAQAKLVTKLQADLERVKDNTREAEATQQELDEIAADQRTQKALLEKEKSKRAILLAGISSKLESQRKEAGNLQRDEQRLSGLVAQLGKIVEEQRRAEAQQARRRALELARKKAQEEKEAKAAAQAKAEAQARNKAAAKDKAGALASRKEPPPGKEVFRPDPIDDDAPPTASKEPAPEPEPKPAPVADMAALRGHMQLPVNGQLVARYGSKRGEGNSWKGLFIRAAEGAQVKSIAPGRIAYADWLRGFGNLVIVDHGNQVMSIYGNNQAVLKRPGDSVKAGEVIASAGNSGGNEFSGLYFELRFQGRPVDPLQWMAKR